MKSLLTRFASTAEMVASLAVYAAAEVARIVATGVNRAVSTIGKLFAAR